MHIKKDPGYLSINNGFIKFILDSGKKSLKVENSFIDYTLC